MENLQIEAGYVIKLLVLCGSGLAYYFYLKNSIGILNERQKHNKRFIECHESDIKELKNRMTKIETQHEDRICQNEKH